jgi:hypothetical protein
MIDFFTYLNTQKTEDKRAFFIHFPAASGKSAFAKKAARLRPDIHYLGLQQALLQASDLPEVYLCDFDWFKVYLLAIQTDKECVLVDNPDILLNTWPADEKNKFTNWIENQLRSPSDTKKTFIFMLQTDSVICSQHIENSLRQPRVVPLDHFNAI